MHTETNKILSQMELDRLKTSLIFFFQVVSEKEAKIWKKNEERVLEN